MITPEIRINTKCPVPTGTDCSSTFKTLCQALLSRPYGDGLFRSASPFSHSARVPSLRGRIVLVFGDNGVWGLSPVPTGTDCSTKWCVTRWRVWSRPYGDGLFLEVINAGINGLGPVPTGTDCSFLSRENTPD